MKLKFTVCFLAAVFFVTSVQAFGLPKINTGNSTVNSIANKTLDTAKNKAIENEINKNIQKQNCAFKPNSSATTCNLDRVISSIVSKKNTLESLGLVSRVYVHVTSHGPSKGNLIYDRDNHVYNTLYGRMSWWLNLKN